MRLLRSPGNRSPLRGEPSPRALTALATFTVACLGVADYFSGPYVAFSIFYLVPICLVAWRVGKRTAFALSVLGSLLWLAADVALLPPVSPWIHGWNAVARLAVFLVVVQTLSELLQARRKQAELTRFIAHDLRSPLSNVMSGLQFLRQSEGRLSEAKREQLLDIALRSSEEILALVNAIIDVARLEEGQMPVEPGDVGVAEVAEAAIAQVSLWAQQRRIAVELHLQTEGARVRADRRLTIRVLVNLLNNALKFGPQGSTVSIRAERLDSDSVVVRVTDQGRGIPEEWVHRIFDPYAQADARRAGAAAGSGLGLTFCRAAMEAQGGRIWVERTGERGTTIALTLPVAREGQRGAESGSAPAQQEPGAS